MYWCLYNVHTIVQVDIFVETLCTQYTVQQILGWIQTQSIHLPLYIQINIKYKPNEPFWISINCSNCTVAFYNIYVYWSVLYY